MQLQTIGTFKLHLGIISALFVKRWKIARVELGLRTLSQEQIYRSNNNVNSLTYFADDVSHLFSSDSDDNEQESKHVILQALLYLSYP